MNIMFAQNAVSNLQRTWSSVANGKMNKIKNLVKALLTNGKDDQAFIGAAWLVALLRITPGSLKPERWR